MSSQTVYFTNPAQISTLQVNTSQLQTQYGTNTYWNLTGTYNNIASYATGYFYGANPSGITLGPLNVAKGTGGATDANGQGTLTYTNLVGNAYTDQEIFFTTGPVNASGDAMDQNTMLHLASAAKFFNSFLWLKAIEDKIINPADAVGAYLPDWNTGNYFYYTGACTGALAPNVYTPIDFTTFTGTRAQAPLSEITIGHCISMNVAFPNTPSMGPGNQQTTWVQPADPNTIIDWSALNSFKDFNQTITYSANQFIAGSGAYDLHQDPKGLVIDMSSAFCPAALLPGNNTQVFLTGTVTDQIVSTLKVMKNGTVPLMWKCGATDTSPLSNIRQQKGVYASINYALISACVSVSLAKAGRPWSGLYTDIYDYFTKRILQPLQIPSNSIYIMGYNAPTGPVGSKNGDILGRRPIYMTTGPAGVNNWLTFGADPTAYAKGLQYVATTGATGVAFNSLYWNANMPGDITCRVINPLQFQYYNKDPLGWNMGIQVVTCFNSWKKIIKLFANKGYYNGQQILSRAMFNWSLNNCINPGAVFEGYNGFPGNGGPNLRWIVAQCMNYVAGEEMSDIFNTTTAGLAPFPGAGGQSIIPPLNKNCYYWAGAAGCGWFLDADSGLFSLQWGCVASLNNNSKPISAVNAYLFFNQAI